MTYDPDDLIDAIVHVNDSYELDLTPDDLRFVGIEWMAPVDVIDDPAHLGGKAYPAGWLLEYPREEWAEELRSTYSRDLDHVIELYETGAMTPAIRIDGLLGDGRGRALFHHAIGAKTMPVAVFRSRRPPRR